MHRQITESRRMPSASSRSNRPITGVLRLSGMLPQSSGLIWSSRKKKEKKDEGGGEDGEVEVEAKHVLLKDPS